MQGGKGRLVHHRLDWLLLLGVGLIVSAGCDSGPKRHHLSGQITHDGKPVPAGEIYFDPDVAKGHDGPQGFARIKDGRYDTRQGGLPATSGPHLVRILGFDGKARPGDELTVGRPLFTEYKKSVDIPAQDNATLDIDVPVRGPGK